MSVLYMYRGDDKTYELTVLNKETGQPVDITGSDIKMTWRKNYGETIFLQKTFSLDDPVNGKATVKIVASDTVTLQTGVTHQFIFDVEITKPDGSKETLLEGKFIILPDVTY